MPALSDEISAYARAIDDLIAGSDSELPRLTLATIIARDTVALRLSQADEAPSAEDIGSVADADRRFIDLAPRIDSVVGGERLANWRRARSPKGESWWWSLDQIAGAKPTWRKRIYTALAVVFLTASIGLVADTFNLLRSVGENPISTTGTLVQAVLAFVAASAFTATGRQWFIAVFSHLGFTNRRFTGLARTGLAFAVLVFTFLIRVYLPGYAAGYFQGRGDKLLKEGLLPSAIVSYQEAVVLDPYSVQTHLALAKAQEKTGDDQKAIENYKSIGVLYERQKRARDDSYYEANIRLAGLLIVAEKDYNAALALLERPTEGRAAISEPNNKRYMYFWYAYRGWANVELKNYQKASEDLASALKDKPDGVTARYLMGRIFQEANHSEQAHSQWVCFIWGVQQNQINNRVRATDEWQEDVRPEWITHVQDQLEQRIDRTFSSPVPCGAPNQTPGPKPDSGSSPTPTSGSQPKRET